MRKVSGLSFESTPKTVEKDSLWSLCFCGREVKGVWGWLSLPQVHRLRYLKTPLIKSEPVSGLWTSPGEPLLYFYSKCMPGIESCLYLPLHLPIGRISVSYLDTQSLSSDLCLSPAVCFQLWCPSLWPPCPWALAPSFHMGMALFFVCPHGALGVVHHHHL